MEVEAAIAELERIGLVFELDAQGYPHMIEVADTSETISRDVQEVIERRWEELVAFLRERAAVPLRRDAEYAEAFNAAVVSCARMIRALPGMMPWVRKEHPALHHDLTTRLPNFVSRLWDAHSPMDDFRRAVLDIEKAMAQAAELYLRKDTDGRRDA